MSIITRDEYKKIIKETGRSPEDVYKTLKSQGVSIAGEDSVRKSIEKENANRKVKERDERLSYAQNNGNVKGFLTKQATNIVGGALESAKGLAKLGFGKLGPVAIKSVGRIMGIDEGRVEELQESFREEVIDQKMGDSDSLGFKATKTIGDVGQVSAASKTIIGAASKTKIGGAIGNILQKTLGGKALAGGVEAVGQTAGLNIIGEQDLPTWEEIGVSGVIGATLPIVGAGIKALGNKAYSSAFQQVKQSLDEKSVERYGIRAGQLVTDESLKGITLKAIKKEVGKGLPQTYSEILTRADDLTPIDAQVLGTKLKSDLVKRMAGNIPKNTDNYKAIAENIDELVDFYLGGSGKIQGREAIALIKQLNSQLPTTALKSSTVVLDPGKISTARKAIKEGIQKFIAKEDENIVKLYGDYSRKKLIQDIIKNVELKKMLGRSLVGGGVGGVALSTDDFARGDFGQGVEQLLLGSLIGGVIFRTSTSPQFLMGLGKTAQTVGGGMEILAPELGAVLANKSLQEGEEDENSENQENQVDKEMD